MAIRNESLGGTDYQDTGSTTLSAGINDSVTTVPVTSTTGFKSSGEIRINSELISYTSVDATNFLGCTRGVFGTTAAAHTSSDDVFEREVVKAVDINDTFDALVNKVQTLTAFWLNDELYDVYDDFESYSVGAFSSNAKWDVNIINGGSADIVLSTVSGGTSKELRFGRTTSSSSDTGDTSGAILKMIDYPSNKHAFMRVALGGSTSGPSGGVLEHRVRTEVSFNKGTNYDDALNFSSSSGTLGSSSGFTTIHVVAKGSDQYDCFIGGKLVRTVTDGSFEIWIRGTLGRISNVSSSQTYIDDVRVSKGVVS